MLPAPLVVPHTRNTHDNRGGIIKNMPAPGYFFVLGRHSICDQKLEGENNMLLLAFAAMAVATATGLVVREFI